MSYVTGEQIRRARECDLLTCILALLIAFGSFVVALLNFLDKRNKHK